MKVRIGSRIAILCLLAALSILIHQYLIIGVFWQMNDFMHHEPLAAAFICFAAGLLIGARVRGGKVTDA